MWPNFVSVRWSSEYLKVYRQGEGAHTRTHTHTHHAQERKKSSTGKRSWRAVRQGERGREEGKVGVVGEEDVGGGNGAEISVNGERDRQGMVGRVDHLNPRHPKLRTRNSDTHESHSTLYIPYNVYNSTYSTT